MVDDLNANETALLISRSGVPSGPRDHRLPYQKRLAVYLILATTFFESIGFYSLTYNLFTILQNEQTFNWDSLHTIPLSFIFFGACYVSTIIFATLSDGKFGRAKTIIIGFCLYLIGYIFIVVIVYDDNGQSICNNRTFTNNNNTFSQREQNQCYYPILGTLLFTAIGIGGIQGNFVVFGAEQVQESYERSRFFDKYLLATNSGAIICFSLVSYLENSVYERNQYFYAFLFAILSLFTAFIIFLAGKQCYIYVKPDETIITKIFPVLINAIRTRWRHRHHKPVLLKMQKQTSSTNMLVETSDEHDDNSITIEKRISSILDYARRINKGKYLDRTIDDIKTVRRIILVFIIIIPYGLTTYQTNTTFLLQSENMKVFYSTQKQRSVIWMTLFDPVGTILSLILLRIIVYKYLDNRNKYISIHFKFIFGMIIASLAMICAGTVEIFRQKSCRPDNPNPILIFSQIPQYIFMSIAELFFSLATLEFAYLAAPNSASSLVMSLRFCSLGFSSFLGYSYVQIYTEKDHEFEYTCGKENNDNYKLYTYFYVLAIIPLITAWILYLCNRKFKILRLHPYKTDKRPFF